MTILIIFSIAVIISVIFYELYLLFIKMPRNVIIKDFKFWNHGIILALLFILLGTVLFSITISGFKDAYYLLIPDYYKSIFRLFDYEELKILRDKFMKEGMYLESITLSFHISNLSRILFSTIQIAVGFVWLLRGFHQYIGEDGIYSSNGNYKWDRIEDFSWGELVQRKTFAGIVDYYNLSFTVKNSKINTKLGFNKPEIVFNIPSDKKVDLNRFLENKILKEK